MPYYHRINNIAEEERLLKEIIDLQTQIRAQREKTRIANTSRSEKYTKNFEPITKSLKSLTDISATRNTIPLTDNNLIDFTERNDLLDEPMLPIMDVKTEDDDDESDTNLPPGQLYLDAVASVPVRARDDGVFGLNVDRQTIGGRPFYVEGNTLKVENDDDTVTTFVINDINVWKLLLTMRPTKVKDKVSGEYIPAVKKYDAIIEQLDLLQSAERNFGKNYKKRAKYKLFMSSSAKGSGFLFSVQPPPFMKKKRKNITIKPSTVVIPSDRKGLMRALVQALAELRAGNTSMRNLVVPLAQEAKRKRILPVNLLSPDEETWVFA